MSFPVMLDLKIPISSNHFLKKNFNCEGQIISACGRFEINY